MSIFPSFNICERDKRLWRNEIVFFRTSIESCKYGSTGFSSFFFLLIAKIVCYSTDKFYLAAEALAIQARAV